MNGLLCLKEEEWEFEHEVAAKKRGKSFVSCRPWMYIHTYYSPIATGPSPLLHEEHPSLSNDN